MEFLDEIHFYQWPERTFLDVIHWSRKSFALYKYSEQASCSNEKPETRIFNRLILATHCSLSVSLDNSNNIQDLLKAIILFTML